MRKRVVIIGAGASGMTAAVFAARAGAEVTLLEHKDRVGKKILSTGNGKCNLSNRRLDESCYRSGLPDFPMEVIRRFPLEKTLEFFEGLGIVIKDRDGYLYPYSGQASSVLDVLRSGLEAERVRVVTECTVKKIISGTATLSKEGGGSGRDRAGKAAGKPDFLVESNQGSFYGDALILACGSKAAPVTGSDGSGYELARRFGHRIIKPLPALVQLRCRESFYKQISGIRTEASVSLWCGSQKLGGDRGELQLTDYGISGIPVFQVSRFAARALDEKRRVTARIDFFPGASRKETAVMMRERRKNHADKAMEAFFTGWFPKKLSQLFLKLAGIRPERPAGSLSEEEIQSLTELIKEFETEIASVNPFENAQICCGGVDVREINPKTLESKRKKGLYLIGELLDVDGICGGYNLQWAWSTGAIAGTHAGRCLYDTN